MSNDLNEELRRAIMENLKNGGQGIEEGKWTEAVATPQNHRTRQAAPETEEDIARASMLAAFQKLETFFGQEKAEKIIERIVAVEAMGPEVFIPTGIALLQTLVELTGKRVPKGDPGFEVVKDILDLIVSEPAPSEPEEEDDYVPDRLIGW